jgi:hypothetical protein
VGSNPAAPILLLINRGVAQLGLRRYLGVVEIVGSNPAAPILFSFSLGRGGGTFLLATFSLKSVDYQLKIE